eukprot:gene11148-biopygen8113
MKAALSAFLKEVSRTAKEGGGLGMDELEAIWQSAKSQVDADEAMLEMEIRHQKEDLAAFMQQCAAHFITTVQQENSYDAKFISLSRNSQKPRHFQNQNQKTGLRP